MKEIIVEPERLESVAGRIEEAKSDYDQLYHRLYETVDKLALAWQGKDNTAFVDQLRSYEENFMQVSLIMSQYAQFLRNAARGYQSTQDELYTRAKSLGV